MVPAAVPALVPRHSCPSSPSLLQHPMPSSPALSHAKARDLGSAPSSPLFHFLSPSHPPLHSSPGRAPDISLSNVHVPLEAIRPSEDGGICLACSQNKEIRASMLPFHCSDWLSPFAVR